jgi:hypothetical protein
MVRGAHSTLATWLEPWQACHVLATHLSAQRLRNLFFEVRTPHGGT